MASELKAKLGELEQEIAKKKNEVDLLEEKKREALKPLEKEWESVTMKQKDILTQEESLSLTRSQLLQREQELDKIRDELDTELKRVSSKSLQLSTTLSEAEEPRISAAAIKENLSKEEESRNKDWNKREEDLTERERKVSFDIEEVEKIKEELKNKEILLNQRERKIKDLYQTLLRTQQRNGSIRTADN